MPLNPGDRLGPYEIAAPIGSGGMGEVYRAVDTRLQRTVAIKMVRWDLARGHDFRQRFRREAQAISSLNHPHVCSLYDIGERYGLDYLVMEYVEGESLAETLKRGPLPVDLAVRHASEIASALAAAHAHGIVHRDLKPSNVMITASGVKVLDFGLAKRSPPSTADAATMEVDTAITSGHILGTVAYMSPEQAEGHPVDARSDIFALGVVLYEMLSGRRPFRGESTLSTLASILRDTPQATKELRSEIPAGLDRIVSRCLTKRPSDRYASADMVVRDLDALAKPAAGITLRRPVVAVAAALTVVVLGGLGARAYVRLANSRWAERVALPQAAQLLERDQPLAALTLMKQAEPYTPTSPELLRLKEDLHLASLSIETTPPGADVYATDYSDPNTSELSHWMHLGRTPIKGSTFPVGYYRYRVVKDGFELVASAYFNVGGIATGLGLFLQLHTKDEPPPGMVWLAPGRTSGSIAVRLSGTPTTPAWIDKYEVSNRQFKEFVDAGGYRKREYWKEKFIKNGQEVAWEEAVSEFRDMTGRPGPSTWEAGTYPDGKADYPVAGVSWYEASAYAEFAGKSLPTVAHWYVAAGFGASGQITSFSNFGGQGPARIGTYLGLAPSGTYDMAGNVKEWASNASGDNRFILGGGWTDLSYMFQQGDARPPFERDVTFGFRCVRYTDPLPEDLTGPLAPIVANPKRDSPADDATFRVFVSLLSYDKTELQANVDSVTDAPHWRRENVSFKAAYGNEKVILHLYLPKDGAPPYQPVLYSGGANTLFARTPDEVTSRTMEYIVKSGRALAFPAYAGTLERGPMPLDIPRARARDVAIMSVKDAARSLDYLETRSDIDMSKLAFYGVSLGAGLGTLALATDARFKAGVFASMGVFDGSLPEVNNWNYAPRIKVPVLMLNGKDDSLFPVEASQKPFFMALGTPEKDKRHSVFSGGHVDFIDRLDVIREALDWFDRYLGPVKR